MYRRVPGFLQSCEQGQAQLHPQQLMQSPGSPCLIAVRRNLAAYGAPLGLCSCTLAPMVFFQDCVVYFLVTGVAPVLCFTGKDSSVKMHPEAPRDCHPSDVHSSIAELLI